MSTDVPSNGGEVIRWRMGAVEDRMKNAERRIDAVENEADDIRLLRQEVEGLKERIKTQTAALWSVVGGLVLLTVAVVFRAGGIG